MLRRKKFHKKTDKKTYFCKNTTPTRPIRSANTAPTDAELLSRYRTTGRTELLGELYARYMELVYGVALKYLRNPSDAEDAVMQLFEELVSKVRRQEIRCFSAWLHTVVRNHCLNQLRQAGRMPASPLPPDLCDEQAMTDLLCNDETRQQQAEALTHCLERLPDPQRRSIRLFFEEKLSYADIAAATSWQLKSVKSYIQNGKRNLRLCLENQPR